MTWGFIETKRTRGKEKWRKEKNEKKRYEDKSKREMKERG